MSMGTGPESMEDLLVANTCIRSTYTHALPDVGVDEVRPAELNERPITGRQIAVDLPLHRAEVQRGLW